MSEVVVRLNVEGSNEMERLMNALDAFARWCQNSAPDDDSNLDIMMTTEHTGESLCRKLVFASQEHASQFLVFWRSEQPVASAIAS